MKEKRLKTSVSTGKVSLHPAQAAGWNVNVRAEHGYGSEKPGFVVAKWLVKKGMRGSSRKRPEKLDLHHEHQLKWEIPADAAPPSASIRFGT
jgi:hypothetical protein